MPLWARVIVAAAGAKTVLGETAYLSGVLPVTSAAGVPGGVYAILAAAYALLGALLIITNRRDVRAMWLGAVFVLISAPLAPVVNASPSAVPLWVVYFRPEALLALFFWRFLAEFPSSRQAGSARGLGGASTVAGVIGFGCLLINLSVASTGMAAMRPAWLATLLFSARPGAYWPIVLGLSVPAFPVLAWRGRSAPDGERRRVQRFVRALLVGVAPITVEVVLEELIPAYKLAVRLPAVRPFVAVALFVPLATVPFTAAFSVLFDRVVEVRVVLRSALQHALARYTVLGLTLVPFAALAVFVVAHREEALVSLLGGPRPLLLGSAAAFGLLVLTKRQGWLGAIDRRYFREAYDAQQILTRFVDHLPATSPADLAGRICRELEGALHAEVAVFLVNEGQTSLRDVQGRAAPLAVDTALVGLLLGDSRPMDVDVGPGSALGRLSEAERTWLAHGSFKLVVALRRTGGGIGGLIALGGKQSGLTYSAKDRHLVSALGAAAGLALDNLRLVTPLSPPLESAARECLECSRLNPPDATQCTCGGTVTTAAAPHVLRGVFRLEQRIGAGGMGVVYRAVDLALGRTVAIKTLPRVNPEGAERLRREARAMATLTHPNLAVIYGLETWQGIPFLVEEYLGGGTLAHRLASAPLSVAETIELGCTLTDVLGELHGAGVVHCDIKPSNIGFGRGGVVKLLDFGLSRLLRGVLAAPEALTEAPGFDASGGPLSASGAWVGTPHYMSPEAATGAHPSPAFDTWALSVVLFEALTGRRPFDGRNAAEIFQRLQAARVDVRDFRPDVPAAFSAFFDVTLASEPARRPSTAGALRGALEALRRDCRMQ